MTTKAKKKSGFEPTEFDTILARAKRERDAALRSMIGSLFGR
ncbi:hypothetical protein [Oricola sp.]|nr:hypothetical protein [Oricola sp.]